MAIQKKIVLRIVLGLIALVVVAIVSIATYSHLYRSGALESVYGVFDSGQAYRPAGFQYEVLIGTEEDSKRFRMWRAVTPEQQENGLQHVDMLHPDEGMVFELADADYVVVWMKNTLVPLDLVWVVDGAIVGFTKNIPIEPGVLDEFLVEYQSPEPVNEFIEMSAGAVERYGLNVGDLVKIDQFPISDAVAL